MGIEQFTVEYGNKSDEELLLLAASFDQLTPDAQDALRLQLRQRHLDIQREDDSPAEEKTRKSDYPSTVGRPNRASGAWQAVWLLFTSQSFMHLPFTSLHECRIGHETCCGYWHRRTPQAVSSSCIPTFLFSVSFLRSPAGCWMRDLDTDQGNTCGLCPLWFSRIS